MEKIENCSRDVNIIDFQLFFLTCSCLVLRLFIKGTFITSISGGRRDLRRDNLLNRRWDMIYLLIGVAIIVLVVCLTSRSPKPSREVLGRVSTDSRINVFDSEEDIITDPAYRTLSCNIFHDTDDD